MNKRSYDVREAATNRGDSMSTDTGTVRTLLDETISTYQAADIAGVGVQTIRRHIRAGDLRAYKVGNRTRLYEDEVRSKYVKIVPVGAMEQA